MQAKLNSKDYIVGMYLRLSRDDERQEIGRAHV